MGFMDALDELGDGITGTITFGQCNGNGCGGDHRGSGINPIGNIINSYDGVKTPAQKQAEQQQQALQLQQAVSGLFPAQQQPLSMAALGLDPQTLQSMVKPGILVIGGLLGLTLVMKLI